MRNGKLTTIIYIRHKNHKGQEVSGYIDYAHRLKIEAFEPYFERKKKLMPTQSDLSFYNWCAPAIENAATRPRQGREAALCTVWFHVHKFEFGTRRLARARAPIVIGDRSRRRFHGRGGGALYRPAVRPAAPARA